MKLVVWWMANVFVFGLMVIWSVDTALVYKYPSDCLPPESYSTKDLEHYRSAGYTTICKKLIIPWYATSSAMRKLFITWTLLIASWVGVLIYSIITVPEVARLIIGGHVVVAVISALGNAFSKRKT